MWYCRGFPSHFTKVRITFGIYLLQLFHVGERNLHRRISTKQFYIDGNHLFAVVHTLDDADSIFPDTTGNCDGIAFLEVHFQFPGLNAQRLHFLFGQRNRL